MGRERKLSRSCGTPPYIAPEVSEEQQVKLVYRLSPFRSMLV